MRKPLIKTMLAILSVAIISGVMIAMLGGCAQKITESLVEKAIENAAEEEGGNVDIDLEEGQINITDEEGNEISLGESEIPEGWPSAVPVNDNITIQFALSEETDNKMNYNISGIFNGTGEELYNYYKDKLSGWDEESSNVMDVAQGKTYSLEVSNDQYYVSLFITESEDSTEVMLTVNEK